jgi:SAM-dependent methyltransferase
MTDSKNNQVCIVCRSPAAAFFITADGVDYYRCPVCRATFLDPAHRMPREKEYERYRQHRNHPDDPAYRAFLSRLAIPFLEVLSDGQSGLDYGCGSGAALAEILKEAGHQVELYDPLFYPDRRVLEQTYDFITCTETAEHFHQPAAEFTGFDRLLRPGGRLAVMTCFQTDDAAFDDWYYRRDPTHVVFYREETLRFIAAGLGWYCRFPVKDVVLMQKPSSGKD